MARDFSGTGQFGGLAAAVVQTPPWSMMAWYNADDVNERAIVQVGTDAGTNQELIYLRASNDRPTWFFNGNVFDTGTAASAGVWQMVLAVCAGDADRTLYFWDGSTLFSGTSAVSVTPSGFDVTSVGRQRDSGSDFSLFDGRIAEVAFWGAALNASEAAALALGVPPPLVRTPSNLVYWPLWGDDGPEPDWKMTTGVVAGANRNALTLTGTPAKGASHAPAGPWWQVTPAAAEVAEVWPVTHRLTPNPQPGSVWSVNA